MATDPVADTRVERACHATTLAVFSGIVAAAILNAEPLVSANDRSRWATVWSFAERGTW